MLEYRVHQNRFKQQLDEIQCWRQWTHNHECLLLLHWSTTRWHQSDGFHTKLQSNFPWHKKWCTSGHEGLPHTEECKGLPSICDSISENQRVSAFENIFHQILHRACEQLPLCCLRAIHLSKEGKRHICTDGKLIVSYLNMRNSPTFWPETEQKRQGMDHL